MPAAQVLDEGMSGDDHLGCSIGPQTTHRLQTMFEPIARACHALGLKVFTTGITQSTCGGIASRVTTSSAVTGSVNR